jgi:hypothetical protein
MTIGPVELLIVDFPGNHFNGELAPALADLVENNTITIIDLLFVHKDTNGDVLILEINDLDDEDYEVFEDALPGELAGLLTRDDALRIAEMLPNNHSAGMLLFENTWATTFAQAVRSAKGEVLLNERIPHIVIEELVAAGQNNG